MLKQIIDFNEACSQILTEALQPNSSSANTQDMLGKHTCEDTLLYWQELDCISTGELCPLAQVCTLIKPI